MFERGEGETEILLGNKQLLAIFFVGAVLLGAAFAGGYMVGRGAAVKKPAPVATLPEPVATDTGTAAQPQVGETHSVAPDETASLAPEDDLLGARKQKTAAAPVAHEDSFDPQSGQEFLQVAAVPRDHALAVASVLRKKGFRAHAVAKPGDASLYRVIVGPIRNAGELSSTRDSLRKTGFNRVLVQHY
jgi:cell division septation protein DedD